jgi:hypothetical protein
MAYYLPAGTARDGEEAPEVTSQMPPGTQRMADMKIFWGPDVCRLEYLIHLLDTGRIKEEGLASDGQFGR